MVTSAKRKKREWEKETATHSHPTPVGPPQSKGKKCFSNGSLGDSICSGSWLRGLRSSGFQPAAEGLLAKLLPVPLLITGLGLGKVFTSLVGSRSCVSSFWQRHFTAFGPPLRRRLPAPQRVVSSFELDSKDTAGCSKNPEPEACSWEASIALLVMRKLEEED